MHEFNFTPKEATSERSVKQMFELVDPLLVAPGDQYMQEVTARVINDPTIVHPSASRSELRDKLHSGIEFPVTDPFKRSVFLQGLYIGTYLIQQIYARPLPEAPFLPEMPSIRTHILNNVDAAFRNPLTGMEGYWKIVEQVPLFDLQGILEPKKEPDASAQSEVIKSVLELQALGLKIDEGYRKKYLDVIPSDVVEEVTDVGMLSIDAYQVGFSLGFARMNSNQRAATRYKR